MNLIEAIQKAESEIGGKIISVFDCEDRWVFGFDFQKNSLYSVVWCCYKDSGELDAFLPSDEPEVGKRAKQISLFYG